MELGTGIFLASIVLGLVYLYGQTKDRWSWGFNADQLKKIKERFKSLMNIIMNIIIIIVLAGVATMLGKIAFDAWQSGLI